MAHSLLRALGMHSTFVLAGSLVIALCFAACGHESDESIDDQKGDSAAVESLVGTWCPYDYGPQRYDQIEFFAPEDQEHLDRGTFRVVTILNKPEDLTKPETRRVISGNYFAGNGKLLFDVEEERIWSGATKAVGADVQAVNEEHEWDYSIEWDWHEFLEKSMWSLDMGALHFLRVDEDCDVI